MNLFIDCEFNGYKGDLISMAIVPEDGKGCWYGVVECDNPGPWVKENVMPILLVAPRPMSEFQALLQMYLAKFDKIHVIADWPEDIAHFCNALITGPGTRLDTPPLTMEVDRRLDSSQSEILHNALYDAIAIRNHWLQLKEGA